MVLIRVHAALAVGLALGLVLGLVLGLAAAAQSPTPPTPFNRIDPPKRLLPSPTPPFESAVRKARPSSHLGPNFREAKPSTHLSPNVQVPDRDKRD